MYKAGAVFSGILIAVMVSINGLLDTYLGGFSTLVVFHTVGLITLIGILLIKRERISLSKDIPIYLYLGGAIGVGMVFSNIVCFKALGVSLTLALGIIGQISFATVIDHFGLLGMDRHPFQKGKITGFLIIFLGIILMMR